MGIVTTINPTFSGVFLALSILYILNYLVTRKDKIQFLYSAVGIIAAIYILLTTYMHQQNNVDDYISVSKWTILVYLILMQSIFYTTYYLNQKRFKWIYNIMTAVTSIVIIILFFLQNQFIYTDNAFIDSFLIGDTPYYLVRGEASDTYVFCVFLFYISSIVYLVYYLVRSDISKKSFRYQMHFVTIFLFIGSNIYDVLIDAGIITHSIFISEYGVLVIVLLFQVDLINSLYKENIDKERLLKLSENFHNLIQDINLYVIGFNDLREVNFINSFSKQKLKNIDKGILIEDFFQIDNLDILAQEINSVSLKSKIGNKILECSFITFNTSDQEVQSYIIGYDITDKVNEHQKLEEALIQLKKLSQQLEEENLDLKIVTKQSNKPNELFVDNFTTSIEKEVKRVANFKSTVLIEGATGTGKKYIADLLIENSNRANKPFVAYNCHSSIKSIFSTQYFENKLSTSGYQRSILDVVNNGTLILSDIENMSEDDQKYLLNLLKEEEGNQLKYDIRFIVTTTKDLKQEARMGNFNMELYQYLSLYKINLPELKNRQSDIPYLVKIFIQKYCKKNNIPEFAVSIATIKKLQSYFWPENLRELKFIIHKAALESKGKSLRLKGFEEYIEEKEKEKKQFLSLDDHEKKYIEEVLKATNWKVSGKKSASEILQINEATLRSKMKKLSIHKNPK